MKEIAVPSLTDAICHGHEVKLPVKVFYNVGGCLVLTFPRHNT